MSDAKTSSQLIESVVNRGHVPVNQSTFDEQNFLDFATEELRLGIVPFIMTMNEDYFLFEIETPILTNKREYTIPPRATGVKLKDLQYRDQNGNYREMTRVSIGDRFEEDYSNSLNDINRFYIKNNKIVLLGKPENSLGSLVFVTYIKPSKLVPDDQVAIISGINRTSGVIVVDKIPELYTTQQKYDFYKSSSPFNLLKIDFNVQSLNNTNKTITVDPSLIPDDLEIGDHFSLANQAIIPQIPEELHVMLAQMITCRLMESQGDTEGLANAQAKLAQMKNDAGAIIDNRVTDAPRKIKNRYSLVKSGAFNHNYTRRR